MRQIVRFQNNVVYHPITECALGTMVKQTINQSTLSLSSSSGAAFPVEDDGLPQCLSLDDCHLRLAMVVPQRSVLHLF